MKRILYGILAFALATAVALAETTRVPSLGATLASIVAANNVWTGSQSFKDNKFAVEDDGDATKDLTFELSGITTANAVVMTFSGTAATPVLTLTGGQLVLGNGSQGAPSVRGTDADSGVYFDTTANGRVLITAAGGVMSIFRSANLTLGTSTLGFSSSIGGTDDLLLSREAAAILQLGADVNGAAVAQTIKAHDGITGTDVAGANFTLAGGRGTGAGAGGNIIKQTAYTLGTGTTAQTLADREIVVAKPKALTAASATAFVEIAVPQGTVAGGTIEYTIRANDATNYQARSGVLVYSVVNPAGTEVCTLSRPDGGTTVDNTTDSVAVSSGTLTNTFTCTVGLTDVVRIAANAASSLTETVLQISYTVRKNEGSGAITPQ